MSVYDDVPAPDAGANAPALIVGNFDVAYDDVRTRKTRHSG